jgi:response regulator RpfG family c-di-GMP phosphodiesterase
MLSFIEAAIAQYELVVAERVLLNNTLKGVINVLSDVVSLVSPEINDRSNRVYYHMDRLAEAIQLKPNWSFNPMVRLSQLGHILFPQSTLEHLSQGKVVSDEDRRLFSQHPRLAYDMLRQIPKMGGIAKTILYQDKGFNGEGIPNDDVKGLDLPLGSRMLKVVCDYVTFESSGASVADSLSKIEANSHLYDPNILLAFKKTLTYESTITLVDVRNINNGMVLSQDLLTSRGQLIASSGQRITPTLLNIITHCLKNNAIKGEVLVSTIAK